MTNKTNCKYLSNSLLVKNNVGIGSLNPGYKLDVDGDINLTGNLRINGTVQTFGAGGSSSYDESSVSITGGSINNTPIGNTTRNTGKFTNIYTDGNCGFGMILLQLSADITNLHSQ